MLEHLGHIEKADLEIATESPTFAYFTFSHSATYLHEPQTLSLQVLWLKDADHHWVSIFQQPDFSVTSADGDPYEDFHQLVEQYQLAAINLNVPWPLETVRIPKPWGAEIWYTGIEARGVCSASGIPLPWLTNLLPNATIGSAKDGAPLLLKILDPLPDRHLGDLYFELHEKKIEVYIVTAIDSTVWPDGVGQIRYGFNQFLRANYKDDETFKAAYLNAVSAYEQSRIKIDKLLDRKRHDAGFAESSEVPLKTMTDWLKEVPVELANEEATLRLKMYQFTHLRDIRVGDVVTVAPFFPHSLQHGVRVIEFQTASYERHILSFAQKVLTQSHWDTEQAVAKAILELPKTEPLEVLDDKNGVRVEVIANFSAFTATRISLNPGTAYALSPGNDYRLMIGVSGEVELGDTTCSSETAFLIPAQCHGLTISTANGAVILIAEPKALSVQKALSA